MTNGNRIRVVIAITLCSVLVIIALAAAFGVKGGEGAREVAVGIVGTLTGLLVGWGKK